jgi:hypothetical protein
MCIKWDVDAIKQEAVKLAEEDAKSVELTVVEHTNDAPNTTVVVIVVIAVVHIEDAAVNLAIQ